MRRKGFIVVSVLLISVVILIPVLAQTTVKGAHAQVTYPLSLETHARNIAQIVDAAWQSYADLYGLPLPQVLQVKITLDPNQRLQLYTDGKDSFFLQLSNERQLLPPHQGGPHNVYGFCHEMGHIVFYHRMKNTTGMPGGIGEGWAHYFGSVIVSHVYEKLGEKAWTPPHNYHESSGVPRLTLQVNNPDYLQRDPVTRAAKTLYDVERKFGRKTLGQAINKTLEQQPTGKELVPKFVAALVEVTGDASAAQLVPQEFLQSGVRWRTQNRDITNKDLYRGLQTETQDGLTRLRYDDGAMDGKRSMAGSGHAVIFRKPEGKWQLIGIEIFGSRYGAPQPPQEDFSISLCDAKFEVLKEFKVPYARFERGAEKWVKIELPATDVPEFFYVCVSFNPTATKGVFVGFDKNAAGHSRMALPDSHVTDAEGFDWMLRCYLKPL